MQPPVVHSHHDHYFLYQLFQPPLTCYSSPWISSSSCTISMEVNYWLLIHVLLSDRFLFCSLEEITTKSAKNFLKRIDTDFSFKLHYTVRHRWRLSLFDPVSGFRELSLHLASPDMIYPCLKYRPQRENIQFIVKINPFLYFWVTCIKPIVTSIFKAIGVIGTTAVTYSHSHF